MPLDRIGPLLLKRVIAVLGPIDTVQAVLLCWANLLISLLKEQRAVQEASLGQQPQLLVEHRFLWVSSQSAVVVTATGAFTRKQAQCGGYAESGDDEAWVLSERNALEPLHHQAPSSCRFGRIEQTGEAGTPLEEEATRVYSVLVGMRRPDRKKWLGPEISSSCSSLPLVRRCDGLYSSFELKLPLLEELNGPLVGRRHASHFWLLALSEGRGVETAQENVSGK
ncbi:hypothetical protein J3F83DRAFT_750121 [Trichoderma novae-zelandiae]